MKKFKFAKDFKNLIIKNIKNGYLLIPAMARLCKICDIMLQKCYKSFTFLLNKSNFLNGFF